MRLARPTGEFVAQMLDPDGWPGVDEDTYLDRAQQYTQVLRQVTEVLRNCRHEQGQIFRADVWSGSAAGAADRKLGTIVDALTTLQSGLATVITWQRYVAGSIIQAKSDISDNVMGAHKQINALRNDSRLTPAKRISAINTVLLAAYGANADVVTLTAEQILASKAWKPPHNALDDLLDEQTPLPDESSSPTPKPGDEPTPGDDPTPGGDPTPGDDDDPLPVVPVVPPVDPVYPVPVIPGGIFPVPAPGTLPGVPRPAVPGAPTVPAAPRRAAASAPSGGVGDGDDDLAAKPSTQSPEAPDSSPRVAPAAATGMPVMPTAPGAAAGGGTGGGAAPGSDSHGGAGVRAAAATSRGRARRDPADGIAVSATRAERDAIAEAATVDAARRSGDRMQLARRIAAALNAPVGGREPDYGFFWVTGLTTDGAIVVANSFGLAYIPDGVQLPDEVSMATADATIPAAERASWATYPALALQGWAAHRGAQLRAVIATEEQLADSDPGVAKVVLDADDIPDSGEMSGLSRLEVVDPDAAERLAETPDGRLLTLLPAAPPNAYPPRDTRRYLWMQILKSFATSDPRRQKPHLQAFREYTAHAQETVANEARTAVDPVAQRCAVGDWLYFRRLTGLLDAALSTAS